MTCWGLTKGWVNKRNAKFLVDNVCGKRTVLNLPAVKWMCGPVIIYKLFVSLYKALTVVIYHILHLSWLRINTTAVRKPHYSMKKNTHLKFHPYMLSLSSNITVCPLLSPCLYTFGFTNHSAFSKEWNLA